MSFGLVWTYNGATATTIATPVTFPGVTTQPQRVQLRSSALDSLTYNSLHNVSFYLTGGDVDKVQTLWPHLGDATNQPEMNGGFEISFDGGHSWNRFDETYGLQSDPSTWVTLPGLAIGQQGQDGLLGPYDVATLYLRYVLPPGETVYQIYDVELVADCDIV